LANDQQGVSSVAMTNYEDRLASPDIFDNQRSLGWRTRIIHT